MSEFDNTNRGALFKADKQGNDRRPDYSGSLNVDGKELFIDAWLKKSKAGQTYMSLSVKPKGGRSKPQPRKPEPEPFGGDEMIPWT